MSRTAEAIILTEEEQTVINEWVKSKTLPARIVQRARIIQMAAHHYENIHIAAKLGISHPTVQLWRDRFLSFRFGRTGKRCSPSGPYAES